MMSCGGPEALQVLESHGPWVAADVQASAHATNLTPLLQTSGTAGKLPLTTTLYAMPSILSMPDLPVRAPVAITEFCAIGFAAMSASCPPPLHVCVVPYTASHHRLHDPEPMSSLRLLLSRQLRHVISFCIQPVTRSWI